VHNKCSVRYYLNLVLVDDEDRRYFKQQEITLYRRDVAKATIADADASTAPPALRAASLVDTISLTPRRAHHTPGATPL
jgi:hypothetical protein